MININITVIVKIIWKHVFFLNGEKHIQIHFSMSIFCQIRTFCFGRHRESYQWISYTLCLERSHDLPLWLRKYSGNDFSFLGTAAKQIFRGHFMRTTSLIFPDYLHADLFCIKDDAHLHIHAYIWTLQYRCQYVYRRKCIVFDTQQIPI